MEEQITKTAEEVVEEAVTNPSSGLSVGLAMLIGSGLTLVVIYGGKKLKKVFEEHKERTGVKYGIARPSDTETEDCSSEVEE